MGKVESMNERAYEKDERFRRYANKYCEHRGITTAEALRHELVSQVRQEYAEGREQSG